LPKAIELLYDPGEHIIGFRAVDEHEEHAYAFREASGKSVGPYIALAVRLGEGRGARELALRPALSGLVVGAVVGLLMMAVLMGVMVVTGLYA
jgi:hypothetical protein